MTAIPLTNSLPRARSASTLSTAIVGTASKRATRSIFARQRSSGTQTLDARNSCGRHDRFDAHNTRASATCTAPLGQSKPHIRRMGRSCL